VWYRRPNWGRSHWGVGLSPLPVITEGIHEMGIHCKVFESLKKKYC
jgi:hypothetical protein